MAASTELEARISTDAALAASPSPNYLHVLPLLFELAEETEALVAAAPVPETRHGIDRSDGLRFSFFVLTSEALYLPVTRTRRLRKEDAAIRVAATGIEEFRLDPVADELWALDFYGPASSHLAGMTFDAAGGATESQELARVICRTFGFGDDDLPTGDDFVVRLQDDVGEAVADQDEEAGEDEEQEDLLSRFETENPWLNKVFAMPAYGRVPTRALDLFREISPDPSERVVAALRTRHGQWRRGYLIATTTCLRYIQTLPTRNENFWSYDYKIDVHGGIGQGGIIETESGDLFQTRWGKAKHFRELYSAMQHAAAWEAANGGRPEAEVVSRAPEPTPPQSLSGEIERLAELHARGVLNDDEFQLAKRRVIESA